MSSSASDLQKVLFLLNTRLQECQERRSGEPYHVIIVAFDLADEGAAQTLGKG
jgi:hypothetical protein